MDRQTRDALVQRYKDGADEVRKAVAEAAEGGGLDRRPEPGEWTAREVVHHLADSEMTSAIRLRRLLAEDNPVIEGYDENAFARRLHYDRPVEASLDAMEASRRSSADLLDAMGDEEWQRRGRHTESGEYSVLRWLELYAAHPYDHAAQIRTAASSSG
jgi:hypothetical protein